MGVEREAGIDQGDENGEDVAHVDGPALVLLGDLQGRRRHDLLPAKAHVSAENDDCGDVEEAPTQRLEDLELHSVDVAHVHGLAAGIVHPEEVQPQLQEGLQVQQVRRRAQLPGMRVAEAEPQTCICRCCRSGRNLLIPTK